jgi:acyl-CoA reductase-like NAD-dependent aldehyde dehydrogenase
MAELTIDGKGVATAKQFAVANPATGEELDQAPVAGPAELDAAVAAARAAWPAWRADREARAEALRASAARLLEEIDALSTTLTAEQGKPVRDARVEVKMMAAWFEHALGLDLGPTLVREDEAARIEVRLEPVGVVAALTPWNFPLALSAWKLAPALWAGNVAVLKPSPLTPLSTLMVGEALRGVLPPGVLNVLSGPEPLGRMLVEHEGVDKVSFTGSIGVGRSVAEAGAARLRRDTLELGGNDAAIVLDSADPAQVAPELAGSAFVNCGQVCSAIKRVYAPRGRAAELAAAIGEAAAALTVGDGADRATRMGPLASPAGRDRVEELIADAKAGGAEVIAGGSRVHGPGWFHEPTVLLVGDPRARVVLEEQFGPVLPIVPYDSVEEAVALANDTEFGLGGSVWGEEDEARTVGDGLECGTVWHNTHVVVGPEQPFGGWKQSGAGVENGPWGLDEFTRLRTIHTRRSR